MRLTLQTDYALRVLILVGATARPFVTISDIATAHGISKNHLTKVVHRLGKLGYLATVRGKCGGVRLGRPAEEIRLGAFCREMEQDTAIVRCMRDDGGTECRVAGECLARDAFEQALDAFFAVLDHTTLADILARQRQVVYSQGSTNAPGEKCPTM